MIDTGGFAAICQSSPVLCVGPRQELLHDWLPDPIVDTNTIKELPSEILPGFLYLGNAEVACSQAALQAIGITAVLNATDTVENRYEDGGEFTCRYYSVRVSDYSNFAADMADRWEGACEWLREARQAGFRCTCVCMLS